MNREINKLDCTELWCEITNKLIEKYKLKTETTTNYTTLYMELCFLRGILVSNKFIESEEE